MLWHTHGGQLRVVRYQLIVCPPWLCMDPTQRYETNTQLRYLPTLI